MKIFITGSTGFVGRNFLEYVIRNYPDSQITCLVRDPRKAEQQWHGENLDVSQVTWLHGDLLEPSTYDAALQKADLVFHIAAMVSLKNGPEFYRMNTDATHHLITSLSGSNRLQRLVFVGSISAIDRPMDQPAIGPLTEETPPHPNTDYGKSKLQAENLITISGLPYSILRPSYIYGPYPRLNSSMARLIHDVKAGKRYTTLPFPGRASEIYVEDLADMIWQAGTLQAALNEVFFVANPEPVVVGDVFPQVAQVLGVSYNRRPVSERWMARYQNILYGRQPENLMLRIMFEDYFYCSPEKWYRLTGVQPRYGYEEGVARTIAWYQKNGFI